MVRPEASVKTITDRVLEALEARGVSGAELARRVPNWTQSYVARRLRGDVPWRAADLTAIADELEMDVAVLLADGGAVSP